MDKRAIWDDFVDVAWSFAVVLIAVIVFNLATAANESKLDDIIQEKDLKLERETFLLNYLRMPVSATDFAQNPEFPSRSSGLIDYTTVSQYTPDDIKKICDKAIADGATIQDIISMTILDEKYIVLAELITKKEEAFKNHFIWIEIGNQRVELNKGKATGKTSSIQIPVAYSDDITTIKVNCRYYSK